MHSQSNSALDAISSAFDFGALAALSTVLIILGIVFMLLYIAAFIVSIIVYKKHVSNGGKISSYIKNLRTPESLRSFFRFDRMLAPGFMQYMYIWLALLSVVNTIAFVVSAIVISIVMAGSIGPMGVVVGIVSGILGGIIMLIFSQILLRFMFEMGILSFKSYQYVQRISGDVGQLGIEEEYEFVPETPSAQRQQPAQGAYSNASPAQYGGQYGYGQGGAYPQTQQSGQYYGGGQYPPGTTGGFGPGPATY